MAFGEGRFDVQAAQKLAAPEGTYHDCGFVFADHVGGWLDLNAVSKVAGEAIARRRLGV